MTLIGFLHVLAFNLLLLTLCVYPLCVGAATNEVYRNRRNRK